MAIGFDKHPQGAFNPSPADYGLGDWYGKTGMMLTTQFFGMKIQRYMHEHGISRRHAGQGRGEGVPQRVQERERLAPHAAVRGPDPRRADARRPAHPVHVLLARRGRRGAGPGLAEQARALTDAPGVPALGRAALAAVRLVRGVQPGARRRARRLAVRRRRAGAFEMAGIGPDDIDVAQVQDTESGAEIMHLAECGFCEDGEQEDLIQSGAHRDRRAPAGQHRRRLPRQRRADRRVRPAPGVRVRAPAARRRRRAPGAGRPADRVHPRLRRAGHLRLHGAQPLAAARPASPRSLRRRASAPRWRRATGGLVRRHAATAGATPARGRRDAGRRRRGRRGCRRPGPARRGRIAAHRRRHDRAEHGDGQRARHLTDQRADRRPCDTSRAGRSLSPATIVGAIVIPMPSPGRRAARRSPTPASSGSAGRSTTGRRS